MVSDFADNLRRVRAILAQIDVSSGVSRVIGLENAGAREIASALANLVGEDRPRPDRLAFVGRLRGERHGRQQTERRDPQSVHLSHRRVLLAPLKRGGGKRGDQLTFLTGGSFQLPSMIEGSFSLGQ